MECHFWFFYSKEFNLKILLNHLQKITEPYRIITNNAEVQNFLSNHGKNAISLGDLFPEESESTEKVYVEAREIKKKYSKIFEKFLFKDVKIFRAFEFHLLLQLAVIIKGKWLLKENKNTVFIFERFSPAYFVIMKIAQEMNYENEIKVGLLSGNKINYFRTTDESDSLTYADKTSRLRAIHFVKHGFGKDMSVEKIQALFTFGFSVFSLFLKKFFYKTMKKNKGIDSILEKINKKILNSSAKYNAICGIFLTTARLDLHLRPILPVIEKFHENNQTVQIFTSDISTSLALSKEKISFISFFEEVNIILYIIKESDKGKQIKEKLEKLVIENNNIIGLSEILPDILRKTFRTMAIIVILDYIFKKMKFKSIVDGGTAEEFENIAFELARKYDISSHSFIPSPPTPSPQIADGYKADKLFLEGFQGAEVMRKLGYDENRIEITGGTRYDHFRTLNSNDSKNFLEKNYQINKEKKLVVIAMSRWHDNDENWVSDFIKFCNKNNFEVIMKIHPTYKVASQNVNEKKNRLISLKCKGLKYIITIDLELVTLLSASDLVLTDWSSVGLEAILLDKPLLQVNFMNEEIESYVRYFDFGASIHVTKYNELEKITNQVLVEEKNLNQLKLGREKVTEQYNFKNDGKAAQRIYEILTK